MFGFFFSLSLSSVFLAPLSSLLSSHFSLFSSWYSDKLQSNELQVRKEPAGLKERSSGASASTDSGGGQGSGKKKISLHSTGGDTTRRLDINREDLWELPKILGAKKAA